MVLENSEKGEVSLDIKKWAMVRMGGEHEGLHGSENSYLDLCVEFIFGGYCLMRERKQGRCFMAKLELAVLHKVSSTIKYQIEEIDLPQNV